MQLNHQEDKIVHNHHRIYHEQVYRHFYDHLSLPIVLLPQMYYSRLINSIGLKMYHRPNYDNITKNWKERRKKTPTSRSVTIRIMTHWMIIVHRSPCAGNAFVIGWPINSQYWNAATNIHQNKWIRLWKIISLFLARSVKLNEMNRSSRRWQNTKFNLQQLTLFCWHFQSSSIRLDCVFRQIKCP